MFWWVKLDRIDIFLTKENLSSFAGCIRIDVAHGAWDIVCSWTGTIETLVIEFFFLCEGVFWGVNVGLWVIEARACLSFYLIESFASSYLGGLRAVLNTLFLRVVSSRTRKVFPFFNFPTHAERHLDSVVCVLSWKIGARTRAFTITIQRLSFSSRNRVWFSLEENFLVLRVVLHQNRLTWFGEGDRSASLTLYFLLKLRLGDEVRSKWVGE